MNYSKNSLPFIVAMIAVSLLIGGTVGYYVGYDNGWEKGVKGFDSAKSTNEKPDNETATTADDGMSMGFIKRVYEQDGTWYAEIDFAQWLSGDEAVEAAVEDTGCSRDSVVQGDCAESLNNNFYIRNRSSIRHTFLFDETTKVSLLTQSPDAPVGLREVGFIEFIDEFNRSSRDDAPLRFFPYDVEIVHDTFVSITQRYTP